MAERVKLHSEEMDGTPKTKVETGLQHHYTEATLEMLDPDDLGQGPSSSTMTTKELQQQWRKVKQRLRPIRLLFEITSSRIIEHTHSKHVVYQIVVIRGSYDPNRVSIERRYSDFARFHHQLLVEFSEELKDVSLPRKLLRGNFNSDNIWERRLALQDYLTKLYNVHVVQHSRHFLDFFTEQEQRCAHGLLRAGQFRPALALLQTVLELQERLAQQQSPALLVPTLCALTVCHRDLDEPEAAIAMAQRALPTVRRYGLKRYRAPLLASVVDLGYQLGRPVAQEQEELTEARDAERGLVSLCSLKEIVVQEFT
ncbi:sorting nexin-20 [Aplochiton taeniatus]